MVQKSIIITNPSGLHLRPAGVLAKEAAKCQSSVKIEYNDKVIECKSVLNIMAAAIKSGSEIVVKCEGPTEEQDLATIISLIESGLGE